MAMFGLPLAPTQGEFEAHAQMGAPRTMCRTSF